MQATEPSVPQIDQTLDVRGEFCPVPALEARRRLDGMTPGQVLRVIASDPLAAVDLQILCDRCAHALLSSSVCDGVLTVLIRVSPGRRPDAG